MLGVTDGYLTLLADVGCAGRHGVVDVHRRCLHAKRCGPLCHHLQRCVRI